ncbi:MAG: hypothetical protein JXP73_11250 [Deltaproteobacteria bacterium]|nr:hypothetical protein [Deltaproteobacteria bacterium]
MRFRPLALAFGAAFAASPAAWAQLQLVSSQGPSLESLSIGMGRQLSTKGLATGLKLGEAAILHASLFADVGYDTNVFYGTSDGTKPAPVLHLGPRLEITNAERDGSIPGGTYYDVFAGVDWRKYLTGDDEITRHDALNPSLSGTVEFSSGQVMSFMLADTFTRYQQPPYAPGDPITRDQNMATAGLKYAPGGGRLKLNLRYTNLIDKYEGNYDIGSNMGNEVVLDIGWRFLPKTSLYVQAAQGLITYFNSGRVTSYPLRTLAGLRGLLTEKLSLNLAAGYNNAFYSAGGSPSGFGNVGIVTEVNYTISILSRLGIGYHHDFANSPFVGQYYDVDAIYGAYQQMIASRVVTYLYGRYENRRFGGLAAGTGRTDNYIVGGISVDYMIGKFFLAGASYSLNLNRSDVTAPAVAAPATTLTGIDYTKHVLLLRVGAVY